MSGIQEDELKETRGTGKMGFVPSIALKVLGHHSPCLGLSFLVWKNESHQLL